MSDVVKKLSELIDLIKNKEEEPSEVEVEFLEEDILEEEEEPEKPLIPDAIEVSWGDLEGVFHMRQDLDRKTSEFAAFIRQFESKKIKSLQALEDLEVKLKTAIEDLERLYNVDGDDQFVLVVDSEEERGVFKKAP
tara:strand:- start:413 stop:820 length:408 start_codon:yes stop_codon:yes gene_type:complete